MHDVVIIGEIARDRRDRDVPRCSWSSTWVGPTGSGTSCPAIGRFNWPVSMLDLGRASSSTATCCINLHIAGYLLYTRYLGRKPNPTAGTCRSCSSRSSGRSRSTRSPRSSTAGLGGRPFWNSALLAPRFLASAFVSGPAFVIVLLAGRTPLRRPSRSATGRSDTLARIMRVTVLRQPVHARLASCSRRSTAGGAHAGPVRYLFFGAHGHHALVPWIWTAVVLNVASAVILHLPRSRTDKRWLIAGVRVRVRRRLDREGHGADHPRLRALDAARDGRVHAERCPSGRSPPGSGRSG